MNDGEMSADRRKRVDLVALIVDNPEGAPEFVDEIVRFTGIVSLKKF